MLPTVVLLPGMDGTGRLFRPFLDASEGELETVVVEYPSRGLCTYSDLVSFVSAHLPHDRRFVLLAESFSGPAAVLVAASNPSGLAGVILCASFAQCPRPVLRYLSPLLSLTATSLIPKFVLRELLLGGFATPALLEDLAKAVAAMEKDVLRGRLRGVFDVDVADTLSRVAVPGLYIAATKDRLVPARAKKAFRLHSSKWQFVEIAGPHLLSQTAPREVVAVVKRFIELL